MTPLFIASEHQLTKMVLELLKLGADPNYVRNAMDVFAPVFGCPRHDGNIEPMPELSGSGVGCRPA